MGTSICRPTSVKSAWTAGWAAVGAGSLQAATNDSTDGTYIVDNVAGTTGLGHQAYFFLGAPSPAIPANAVIKRITPIVRASQVTGSTRIGAEVRVYSGGGSKVLYAAGGNYVRPTTTIQTFRFASGTYWLGAPASDPYATVAWLSTHLEILVRVPLSEAPYNVFGDDRIHDVSVEIEYDEEPDASPALNPSGAATQTSRPGIDLGYSDPEGSRMRGYRVVVWSAADAADANCPDAAATTFIAATGGTRRNALAYSGTKADPSVYTSTDTFQVTQDLPNGSLVAFVQVADDVAGNARWASAAQSLAWTQNVTSPPAPTGIAASWVASPTWAAKVDVTVGAWSRTPATTRRIEVQRSTDGGVTWSPVTQGPSPALNGQAGATVTVWDAALPNGRAAVYRARALHDDGSFTYVSAFSSTSGSVTGVIDRWLLRDPADTGTAPLQLSIAGDLTSTAHEAATFFQPVGSPVEVKVAQDGAVGGEIWPVTLTFIGETAWQAFVALRARQTTLLLEGDMAGWARWVGLGADVRPTVLMSTARLSATKTPRSVEVELHEVEAPSGQPQQL